MEHRKIFLSFNICTIDFAELNITCGVCKFSFIKRVYTGPIGVRYSTRASLYNQIFLQTETEKDN